MEHENQALPDRDIAPRESSNDTAAQDIDRTQSLATDRDNGLECLQLIERVRRHSPGVFDDLVSNDFVELPEAPLATDEFTTPSRLGRFEVESLIGQGGYGIVYRARDPELERFVALKVPRLASLTTEVDRLRFVREAKALSSLGHPNIATLYEAGCSGLIPYTVSEYYSGGSLADLLSEQGPLPCRFAARIARTLAAAVEHAHARGVLHRDLKPGNILFATPLDHHLDPDEVAPRLRITDFGLAKLVDDDEQRLTLSVAYVGTPAYMSPEQAEGDVTEIGVHTDIYALGAILYELLTGQPPLKRESNLATLQAVRTDLPTPIRRLRPQVPPDLEAICLKCLEKSPQDRYPTAAALVEDLDAFLSGRPVHARPKPAVQRLWQYAKRQPLVAVLVLAMTGLAFGGPLAAVWINYERQRAEANLGLANRQARQAKEAEQRAQQRLDQTIAAIDEMLSQLHALKWVPESRTARQELLLRVDQLTQQLSRERHDLRIDRLRARTLLQLAKLESELAEFDTARTTAQQSVELARQLVADEPRNPALQVTLADALNGLAITCNQLGRTNEAVAAGKECLSLYEQFASHDPATQVAALRGYGNLAYWQMRDNSVAEAEHTVRQGVKLCQDMEVAKSHDGDLIDAYAYLTYRFGQCLNRQGRRNEAFEKLDQAGRLWAQLYELPSIQPAKYLRYWGECAVEAARYPRQDALPDWVDVAAQQLFQYCRRHPSDRSILLTAGILGNRLGIRHRESGAYQKGIKTLNNAIFVYSQLTATAPSDLRRRCDLGGAWNNLALVQLKLKDPQGAWESIQQAIPIQRKVLEENPKFDLSKSYLSNHLMVATQVQLLLGDPQSAANFAAQRLELNPDSPQQCLSVAHDLCRIALWSQNSEDTNHHSLAVSLQDDAVDAIRKALRIGIPKPTLVTDHRLFVSVLADHPGFQELVAQLNNQ